MTTSLRRKGGCCLICPSHFKKEIEKTILVEGRIVHAIWSCLDYSSLCLVLFISRWKDDSVHIITEIRVNRSVFQLRIIFQLSSFDPPTDFAPEGLKESAFFFSSSHTTFCIFEQQHVILKCNHVKVTLIF